MRLEVGDVVFMTRMVETAQGLDSRPECKVHAGVRKEKPIAGGRKSP